MSQLRLYAVGIDDVRELFGAEPALAARIRALAAPELPPAPPEPRGWLHVLGPMLKRPLPTPPPDRPVRADLEAILAGSHIAPERTRPAWRLLGTILGGIAWGSLCRDLAPDGMDRLDFELARAGLPADLALDRAFTHDAALPLRPLPGMRIGYRRLGHALAMAEGWQRARADVDPDSRACADAVTDWLAGFPGWARAAEQAGRAAPDLVAVWLA